MIAVVLAWTAVVEAGAPPEAVSAALAGNQEPLRQWLADNGRDDAAARDRCAKDLDVQPQPPSRIPAPSEPPPRGSG
ncbi:hypothetical protein [Streptacidiphilus cavernicola]|uniref:Uncharacterized protein n=1 Tax=Streptacidiphilus cavernicola TaxID=3342716 RepID=A0ABV6VYF0_9ACTN